MVIGAGTFLYVSRGVFVEAHLVVDGVHSMCESFLPHVMQGVALPAN